jgi:RNA polymerase sigma factor (sigma-70 family)
MTRERLVQDHLTAIYSLIYSQVGNREEAEELTAQVFAMASRQLGSLGAKDPREHLVGLAQAAIAGYWHAFSSPDDASKDDTVTQIALPSAGKHTATWSSAQRVDRMLRRLPERERAVITHRLLLSKTTEETAQAMRIPEAAVAKLLYDALALAAELDPIQEMLH